MEPRYWPFDVGPREKLSDEDQSIVRFLEQAFVEGYKPHERGIGSFSYGASADNHRAGAVIVRGRNRWELILSVEHDEVLSGYLDNFGCAANAVLCWLRGDDVQAILAALHDHWVLPPGASRSFSLSLPEGVVIPSATNFGPAS